jgi:hypothetical protein
MATNSVVSTSEGTTLSLTNPHTPPKRRRAKRSEAERIAYLRADPYVAKFDAYRALCASCDKWIRLRPNSTYCSIPWEAHRKGCLTRRPYVHPSYVCSSGILIILLLLGTCTPEKSLTGCLRMTLASASSTPKGFFAPFVTLGLLYIQTSMQKLPISGSNIDQHVRTTTL